MLILFSVNHPSATVSIEFNTSLQSYPFLRGRDLRWFPKAEKGSLFNTFQPDIGLTDHIDRYTTIDCISLWKSKLYQYEYTTTY